MTSEKLADCPNVPEEKNWSGISDFHIEHNGPEIKTGGPEEKTGASRGLHKPPGEPSFFQVHLTWPRRREGSEAQG